MGQTTVDFLGRVCAKENSAHPIHLTACHAQVIANISWLCQLVKKLHPMLHITRLANNRPTIDTISTAGPPQRKQHMKKLKEQFKHTFCYASMHAASCLYRQK
ncbi:hypothetical protein PR048_009430 [Dryococelus australis]|uniref:Uncharacterized protein n=1 Tax=Dryococelus australis TaxID=614101 RepID=A0ABQ9HZV2_9NEOP|nr:hypothetical protein PR048_009430 [Dryococelus australis]